MKHSFLMVWISLTGCYTAQNKGTRSNVTSVSRAWKKNKKKTWAAACVHVKIDHKDWTKKRGCLPWFFFNESTQLLELSEILRNQFIPQWENISHIARHVLYFLVFGYYQRKEPFSEHKTCYEISWVCLMYDSKEQAEFFSSLCPKPVCRPS